MTPTTRTAEYILLSKLAEGRQRADTLNQIALERATEDHLVVRAIGWVILSKAGEQRLEELNDK